MSRRAFGYVVAALLLVAGLVAVYLVTDSPEPEAAADLPKPVTVRWADGTRADVDDARTKLVWKRALAELADAGITETDLFKNGYTIELTLDPKIQRMAERVITDVRRGQPENLRAALVAVDPANGRIVAYHGHQPENPGTDYASSWFNPGTGFTPFVLVALLHKQLRIDSMWDGTSPRKFGGVIINNAPGTDCGRPCTVATAMKDSVNTVFAEITFDAVGTRAVARAAIEAGIPPNIGTKKVPLEGQPGVAPDLNISLGGGQYVVRPVDMAGAYATFAANGMRTSPHLVAKVLDPSRDNALVLDQDKSSTPAFNATDPANNAKIARAVTETLLPAGLPCTDNRPCASKAGTHGCAGDRPGKVTRTDICAASMTGYTPQLSTSVMLGTDDNSALGEKDGRPIDGKSLPGQAWQKFMNEYLAGKPVVPFPPLDL